MMYNIDVVLSTIEQFRTLGYWIILVMLFFDSVAFVGLLSPGTAVMMGVGFLSSQGALDIGDSIIFATVGAVLGDIFSYYLGMHASRKMFDDNNRFLKMKYIQMGESFFSKYGSKAILIDRLVGPVRPIATFIAGMSNMDKKMFMFWSVISSTIWVMIFLLIGYSSEQTLRYVKSIPAILGVLVGLFITVMVSTKIIKKLLLR